jgi:hypothetical protein
MAVSRPQKSTHRSHFSRRDLPKLSPEDGLVARSLRKATPTGVHFTARADLGAPHHSPTRIDAKCTGTASSPEREHRFDVATASTVEVGRGERSRTRPLPRRPQRARRDLRNVHSIPASQDERRVKRVRRFQRSLRSAGEFSEFPRQSGTNFSSVSSKFGLSGKEVASIYDRNSAEAARRETARADAQAQALLAQCGPKPKVFELNGSLVGAKEFVQRTANDPDSIEVTNCSEPFVKPGTCWSVVCDVRGKNAFNAKVLNRMVFTIRNGDVVGAQ